MKGNRIDMVLGDGSEMGGGVPGDGNRRNQVAGRIEGESTWRDNWNQRHFWDEHKNLVQWKLPEIYHGDPR